MSSLARSPSRRGSRSNAASWVIASNSPNVFIAASESSLRAAAGRRLAVLGLDQGRVGLELALGVLLGDGWFAGRPRPGATRPATTGW